MSAPEFVDYYEVLQVSPNANEETIERIFRYLGQRLHPDNAETGDDEKFRLLLQAYTVLRDPAKRTAYDAARHTNQKSGVQLANGAAATGDDSADRHRLLSLFYSQRRRNMKQPGVGLSTLEQLMRCPREVLEFHLWYFREKAWVKREECGLFAITAEGIDRIESSPETITARNRILTMRADAGALNNNAAVAHISQGHSAHVGAVS